MSDSASLPLVPHFVQVGHEPVFVGTGAEELSCACGRSVLVRSYQPGSLLGIDIQCALCSDITSTPGLAADAVLPAGTRVVTRERREVATPIVLSADMVLGDRDALAQSDERAKPGRLPAGPLVLLPEPIGVLAAQAERLSGGGWAADRAAMRPDKVDLATGVPALPLAWAFEQLSPSLDSPGWWCLAQEPDTVAAIQLGAFREFVAVWSQHPLFAAMAASGAAGGFSSHALAAFAAAQNLAAAGNRVAFDPPAPGQTVIDSFRLENNPVEPLSVVVRRFDRFDWPRSASRDPAAVRAAAIDALIASQGRINAKRPGMLVLSVGAVHRESDMAIITTLAQVLADRWRKHRGLVGVAASPTEATFGTA